jgi:hypothetical protein
MPRIRFGDLEQRVEGRFETLWEIADKSVGHEMFRDRHGHPELAFLPEGLLASVEAYYLLNDAYKIEHGIESTEPPKIAAMMSVVVADFQPLRSLDPANVSIRPSVYANEYLALEIAAAAFAERVKGGELIDRLGDVGVRRFRRLLRGTRIATLGAFRGDTERGQRSEQYDIRLPYASGLAVPWREDLAIIEAFVLFFEQLWNGHDGWRD